MGRGEEEGEGGIGWLKVCLSIGAVQYYKHAAAIMDRSLRRAKPSCRASIMFVISAVLRRARADNGAKDRLLKRMEPLLPHMFAALSEGSKEQGVRRISFLIIAFEPHR